MATALKQTVTVQPGGRIEIASPELPPGAKAEVIVRLARGGRWAKARARQGKPRSPQRGRRAGGVESYFGSINSGDSHAADNDRIDADLAKEYGRGLDREV